MNTRNSENYENPELCAACGGACCQQMPGDCYPSDFKRVNKKVLKSLLASGYYCVDYLYETDGWFIRRKQRKGLEAFYLRPAIQGREGVLYDIHFGGGACTFWTQRFGCALPHDKRPAECRALKPGPEHSCSTTIETSQRITAKLWLPFQSAIEAAVKELEGERSMSRKASTPA